MATITLKMPPDLARRLDDEAKSRRMSRSALIRSAVSRLLEDPKPSAPPSAFDLTGPAVGALDGPEDLSTHPGHLDGYGA